MKTTWFFIASPIWKRHVVSHVLSTSILRDWVPSLTYSGPGFGIFAYEGMSHFPQFCFEARCSKASKAGYRGFASRKTGGVAWCVATVLSAVRRRKHSGANMLILVELARSVGESTFDADLLHLDCRLFILNSFLCNNMQYDHPKRIADFGRIIVDLRLYQLLICWYLLIARFVLALLWTDWTANVFRFFEAGPGHLDGFRIEDTGTTLVGSPHWWDHRLREPTNQGYPPVTVSSGKLLQVIDSAICFFWRYTTVYPQNRSLWNWKVMTRHWTFVFCHGSGFRIPVSSPTSRRRSRWVRSKSWGFALRSSKQWKRMIGCCQLLYSRRCGPAEETKKDKSWMWRPNGTSI